MSLCRVSLPYTVIDYRLYQGLLFLPLCVFFCPLCQQNNSARNSAITDNLCDAVVQHAMSWLTLPLKHAPLNVCCHAVLHQSVYRHK